MTYSPDTDLATLRSLLPMNGEGCGCETCQQNLAAFRGVEAELARLRCKLDDTETLLLDRNKAAVVAEAELARLQGREKEAWDYEHKMMVRATKAERQLDAAKAELAQLRQEHERIVEEAWEDRGELARLREGLPRLLRWVELITKHRVGEGTYAANDDPFTIEGRELYNLMQAAEPLRALLAEDGAAPLFPEGPGEDSGYGL